MNYGVCRHKAMLFKFLCDYKGIDCNIFIGKYDNNK